MEVNAEYASCGTNCHVSLVARGTRSRLTGSWWILRRCTVQLF